MVKTVGAGGGCLGEIFYDITTEKCSELRKTCLQIGKSTSTNNKAQVRGQEMEFWIQVYQLEVIGQYWKWESEELSSYLKIKYNQIDSQ